MKMNWPAIRFGCLLLGGVAIAMLPVRAQTVHEATASPTALAISGIEVSQQGQQTSVRISGNGELRCHTSRLEGPPRLVLDFGDTRLAFSKNKLASQFYPVQDVRLGQPQSGPLRVVIDLAEFVPYTVQTEGSNLTISFHTPASKDQTGNVSAGMFQPVNKVAHAKLVAAKAPAMPLPSMLTERDIAFADAREPAAPVTRQAVSATDNMTAMTTAQQTPVTTTTKKYTGDPISVNLKDVDLKDFFRLIHEISGLNVVLDPSVHGNVTLVLDEVPWDQALDIVLQNNGLTAQIDGNVLRIATQDTLRREADQKRDLVIAQQASVETVTITRVLSYAKADTVMVTIIKKFVTPRGDVYADARTNTLIIKDIPSQLPKIEDLIRQLDRKSRQVEIDARVVEASRTFARDIGTQFGFSTPTGATGNTILGGLTGTGSALSPVVHSIVAPLSAAAGSAGSSIPLSTNLGATAPTSGFTFSTQGHNYAIDFILSMMESRGAGKVLSEPKGITQNNEKLTVKQGTQIPIQTTINNTISVQYVDAVLKLEVTPQISAEGTVFMDITVENTSIDKTILVQGTPGLDTQSTQTKVLINDGGTVVIGGVVVNNQTTEVDQVPLLGSVPLIGNLFKHTTINVSTQELLFFVTPRILPG